MAGWHEQNSTRWRLRRNLVTLVRTLRVNESDFKVVDLRRSVSDFSWEKFNKYYFIFVYTTAAAEK